MPFARTVLDFRPALLAVDGARLLVADMEGGVRVLDVATGAWRVALPTAPRPLPTPLAFVGGALVRERDGNVEVAPLDGGDPRVVVPYEATPHAGRPFGAIRGAWSVADGLAWSAWRDDRGEREVLHLWTDFASGVTRWLSGTRWPAGTIGPSVPGLVGAAEGRRFAWLEYDEAPARELRWQDRALHVEGPPGWRLCTVDLPDGPIRRVAVPARLPRATHLAGDIVWIAAETRDPASAPSLWRVEGGSVARGPAFPTRAVRDVRVYGDHALWLDTETGALHRLALATGRDVVVAPARDRCASRDLAIAGGCAWWLETPDPSWKPAAAPPAALCRSDL